MGVILQTQMPHCKFAKTGLVMQTIRRELSVELKVLSYLTIISFSTTEVTEKFVTAVNYCKGH
jgi:hypothetical protein